MNQEGNPKIETPISDEEFREEYPCTVEEKPVVRADLGEHSCAICN